MQCDIGAKAGDYVKAVMAAINWSNPDQNDTARHRSRARVAFGDVFCSRQENLILRNFRLDPTPLDDPPDEKIAERRQI
ncbi:MAG: hypothetical protein ACR65T_00020 [Methylocystis sp.]|uniref:hypothetical protein n=1 Tax=Methylocystis sp. TaxID=1911079 RepID=UPI003DA564A6